MTISRIKDHRRKGVEGKEALQRTMRSEDNILGVMLRDASRACHSTVGNAATATEAADDAACKMSTEQAGERTDSDAERAQDL